MLVEIRMFQMTLKMKPRIVVYPRLLHNACLVTIPSFRWYSIAPTHGSWMDGQAELTWIAG